LTKAGGNVDLNKFYDLIRCLTDANNIDRKASRPTEREAKTSATAGSDFASAEANDPSGRTPATLVDRLSIEVLPGTGTSSINLDNISVNPMNGTVVPDSGEGMLFASALALPD